MNILNLINEKNCVGCHSCANICPVSAIKMISNSEGFGIPLIIENKCIDCGKCIEACPIINAPQVNKYNEYYAVFSKSTEMHLSSASGGFFSTLAHYILEKGGYVAGATFDQNLKLHHILIDQIRDLEKLVGTKYVQSEIGDILKKIKYILDKKKFVLFCGTPCQVAGLKSYLKKEYSNLYCIDLICHGVPSPLIWNKYLEELSPVDKINKMTFRKKKIENLGWPIVFYCESGKIISENYHDNKFIKGFINNYYLRSSCYNCHFKGLMRCSDFTIGDFWGIENYDKALKHKLGTSMCIVHSEKGKEIFNCVCKDLIYKKIEENIAMEISRVSNICLFDSVKYTKKREIFFKEYKIKGVMVTIDRLSKKTILDRFRKKFYKTMLRLISYVKRRVCYLWKN